MNRPGTQVPGCLLSFAASSQSESPGLDSGAFVLFSVVGATSHGNSKGRGFASQDHCEGAVAADNGRVGIGTEAVRFHIGDDEPRVGTRHPSAERTRRMTFLIHASRHLPTSKRHHVDGRMERRRKESGITLTGNPYECRVPSGGCRVPGGENVYLWHSEEQ